VYGAGGGTTSYEEMEHTDLLLLWGSNPRETHPVMFHHMLRGLRNGARMVVVDPRVSPTAEFAHVHLQIPVGADIALANAIGHVIIAEGLQHRAFVANATEGYEAYAACVAAYPPERAEAITGIPAERIREVARMYATAPRAIITWTLGITEHHNATDGVYALCNLANLTGHVGRYGSGLDPLRGQNNVQGGGDMGALPNKLPGTWDVTDPAARARFEAAWGCAIPPKPGLHQSLMFEAMERGEIRCAYVIGENPLMSEANQERVRRLLAGLELLVVQDICMTQTAEIADVVLPSAAAWCECEGTVTNSERRVQLMRKALDPPGQARDDIMIVQDLARRLGQAWSYTCAEDVWNEVRRLSPLHAGMSYARLQALGGLQWPCPDEGHPGSKFLHARLWKWPVQGKRAPFIPVEWEPPAEQPDAAYPFLLTTGRRLEFYNTGVQSRGYAAARPQADALCIWPADAERLGIAEGDPVRVRSRRGALVLAAHLDPRLAPGLCFMTLHHPDTAPTNVLTLDAWDPKSGTAEFKATAVAVERVEARALGAEPAGARGAG
jgi:predicted molibdopterin-dependent oxidoreductase YjgC